MLGQHPLHKTEYLRHLDGRHALEIGGPTEMFTDDGELPVYGVLRGADNCLFSARTLWTGRVEDGGSYRFHPSRPPGRQFIAEATDLKPVADSSYDCVLASHCLEHIANPLRALAEWKRIIREGGALLLVLPHRDGTFDWKRPVTPLQHMVEDYRNNVGEDDLTHLPEVLALHDLSKDKPAGTAEQFRQRCLDNYSNRAMHQHVFDSQTAAELVDCAGFEVIRVDPRKPLNIFILARRSEESQDNSAFLASNATFLTGSPFPSDHPRVRTAQWGQASCRPSSVTAIGMANSDANSRLAVCMVAGTYPPARCGVGDHSEQLCEALAARGVSTTVLTSSYLGVHRHERAKNQLAVLPLIKGWSPLHFLHCLGRILNVPADVYHFQFPNTQVSKRLLPFALVPVLKLLRRRSKVVVTFHEPPVVGRRSGFVKSLGRFAQSWLCVHGTDALVVLESGYEPILKVAFRHARSVPFMISPNAAIIPKSELGPQQLKSLRTRFAKNGDGPLIAYVGYINPAKGIENVFDVLKILRSRGLPARLLVLAELSPQNAYHRLVARRLAEERLDASASVLGFLDRVSVANHLAASDVCILPFVDGVGPKSGTFLAAVTQGVFTITTSADGHGLDKFENVYYTAPGDAQDMANAAQRYAGRKGPGRSTRLDDWLKIASMHIDFYQSLFVDSAQADNSQVPIITE